MHNPTKCGIVDSDLVTVQHMMLDARSWILDPLPASKIEHRGSSIEFVP
ncbi:MAG: hypothetical protein AB1797_05585 [bacterium]